MWRKWFKRFGARVIMMETVNGDVLFSFAKFTEHGVIANKIIGKALLPLDGTGGYSYIKRWYEI